MALLVLDHFEPNFILRHPSNEFPGGWGGLFVAPPSLLISLSQPDITFPKLDNESLCRRGGAQLILLAPARWDAEPGSTQSLKFNGVKSHNQGWISSARQVGQTPRKLHQLAFSRGADFSFSVSHEYLWVKCPSKESKSS